MIGSLFRRELTVLLRNRANLVNPLAFMFLGILLFAVASPAQGEGRVLYAPAILWLIVLLTNLLSLDGLFRRDYDNGVLEQIYTSADVPFMVVLVRIIVQWMSTGLVMVLLAPVLGLLLGIDGGDLLIVVMALLLGTPALSFLGAVGASLTVGFSRGGVLLGLLVLPLYLPVLIFGASAIQEQISGAGNTAQLYWLGVISMLSLTIGPLAATAGLKISLQMQ